MMKRFHLARYTRLRRQPFISLFANFPRLRLAAFEPRVGAWVSRAAEPDFVPSPRVGIIGLNRIAHDHSPEAVNGHPLPDCRRGLRTPIVQALQHFFLLPVPENGKASREAGLRFRVNRFDT